MRNLAGHLFLPAACIVPVSVHMRSPSLDVQSIAPLSTLGPVHLPLFSFFPGFAVPPARHFPLPFLPAEDKTFVLPARFLFGMVLSRVRTPREFPPSPPIFTWCPPFHAPVPTSSGAVRHFFFHFNPQAFFPFFFPPSLFSLTEEDQFLSG